MNEEDAVLIPKKSRRKIFKRIFALGIFWGGVCRYVVTTLIVALSPGHSVITRFRPLSPIAKVFISIAPKKFQNVLRRLATLTFLIRVQAFRDPLREELQLFPYLHE